MQIKSKIKKLTNLQVYKLTSSCGISLVEIVIGASIVAVALVVLVNSYALTARYALSDTKVLKSAMLSEEGVEVLKFMRDSGWATNIAPLTNGTTYRFLWNGSKWVSATNAFFIDSRFDRTFVLSAVNRDASNNVVSSGGTFDSGSKKATISVAWREGSATTTKTIEMYLFNIFNN